MSRIAIVRITGVLLSAGLVGICAPAGPAAACGVSYHYTFSVVNVLNGETTSCSTGTSLIGVGLGAALAVAALTVVATRLLRRGEAAAAALEPDQDGGVDAAGAAGERGSGTPDPLAGYLRSVGIAPVPSRDRSGPR